MKRVLFLTTRPVLGGAQRWTYDQFQILDSDFDLYLSTSEEGWLTQKTRPLCRDILLDERIDGHISLGYFFRLYRFVVKNHIDLIIASSAYAGVYARFLRLFSPKLKIVYISHGWSSVYRGNAWMRLAERLLSYLSTCIVAVSESDYEKAIDFIKIKPEKMVLLENALFPCKNETKVSEGVTRTRMTAVMVARFEHPKRQDLLIEAARQMPYIDFKLVGEGSTLEPLRINAPSNVDFLQASTDIEEVLNRSDIFVLLSDSEGMPMSVIEALSCGKPVVLSSLAAMKVFIRGNGVLVDNSIGAVVEGFAQIRNMDLSFMAEQSRKLFNDRFNLDTKREKYIAFYQNLTYSDYDE